MTLFVKKLYHKNEKMVFFCNNNPKHAIISLIISKFACYTIWVYNS